MSTFVVDPSAPQAVTIGATGLEEILQNVRTILTTIRGTVPLDRSFGLSLTFLDQPLPAALAAYSGEVVEAVERLEPRVRVRSVEFTDADADGRLYPVVTLNIPEGV